MSVPTGVTVDRDAQSKCAQRNRFRSPDALRPSDLVTTYFIVALLFLATGAAVASLNGIVGLGQYGRWLGLHLVFVGGISQLIVGASQFFVGAALATDPPPYRLIRTQLAVWNLGVLATAFGVPTRSEMLVAVGVTLLLLGLALYAWALRSMQRKSLQRWNFAVRWYYSCIVFLVLGATTGALLARGVSWPYGDLLGAHLSFNVVGWFGAAIVGTLHTFYPSITHTTLRAPRLQTGTYWCWMGGVTVLAVGLGFNLIPLVPVGWLLLSAATLQLAANVFFCAKTGWPLSLPGRLVGLGQLFLVLGMSTVLVTALTDPSGLPVGAQRNAIAVLLLVGWVGLTVTGSLLHLLRVLRRVRDLSRSWPEQAEGIECYLPSSLGLGITLLALAALIESQPLTVLSGTLTVGGYLYLGIRILKLSVQTARAAPLRI